MEIAVRGQHSHLFRNRLSNNEAIKGIIMVQREIVNLDSMQMRNG